MHVVRFHEAASYAAPGHFEITMLGLQGRETGRSSDLWTGISTIVLDGEVETSKGQTTAALAPRDSCRIAPGEDRQLRNAAKRLRSYCSQSHFRANSEAKVKCPGW
jgi:hypothetical protein